MDQPTSAKTDCLNQDTCAVEEGDREPARFKRVRQNLRDDENGHAGAGNGREQPDDFKLARASPALSQERHKGR